MSSLSNITIGDFVALQRGHDLTHKERTPGKYPVVGAAGENGTHSEYKADSPGIVIGRSGGSYGQVHMVRKKFWPHNTAMYVTDFKGNDPDFTYYFLKNLDFDNLNSGSAQPSLNRNFLYPVKITVPKPKKQKLIGEFIAALDKKIELNNRINAELEAMAKMLYDYWFVQFDFPDANGKPYKTSGGKMVWNKRLKREIPEGWEGKILCDVATTGSGGTPKSTERRYYEKGTIPWINSGELNSPHIISTDNYISEAGLENSSAKIFPKNTLLVALYGATAGKAAISHLEASTNQAVCAVLVERPELKNYLRFLIGDLYSHLVTLSSGSARDNLSQSGLRDLPVLEPDSALLNQFERVVSGQVDMIRLHLLENKELTKLRDWLLPMLMNGQVMVGN